MITALRVLCFALFAVSLGLGGTILVYARHTMRPRGTGRLMWWHILAITLAVWSWEVQALVPIADRLAADTLLTWRGPVFALTAILTIVALYLILKVQRGRLALGRRGPRSG